MRCVGVAIADVDGPVCICHGLKKGKWPGVVMVKCHNHIGLGFMILRLGWD